MKELEICSSFEELVRFYPKKDTGLSFWGYGELKEEKNNCQLWKLLMIKDFLIKKMNMFLSTALNEAEAPLKAARVIEYGIEESLLKKMKNILSI